VNEKRQKQWQEMRRDYPRMKHSLVRIAADGRKTLNLGWHAVAIEGGGREVGESQRDELFAFATQERYVYSHKWRPGDLVIWDNRCAMHSTTSFERYRYRLRLEDWGPRVVASRFGYSEIGSNYKELCW